jgi:hypothetical protein
MTAITDGQVARLSGASAAASYGKYRVTVTLPVILYGDPYRWEYLRDIPGGSDAGDYGDGWRDTRGGVETVAREVVMRDLGVTREKDITSERLDAAGYGRRRKTAITCYEQGTVTGLLVIRPGASQDAVASVLAEVASGSMPGLAGKGGRRQEIDRGRARSAAVSAALGDLERPGSYRIPAEKVHGSDWDKLPGIQQPGAEPGRQRVLERRTA